MLSCCFWVVSDLCAFGQFQFVLYVNSQISHRAIIFGMTKEYLNGTGVSGRHGAPPMMSKADIG